MDFHGIDTKGKIWLERINSKPAFTSAWNGRIIFALDTFTLSIGISGTGWVDIANALGVIETPHVPDIPSLTIMLIESDTSITGWSLLTTVDDEVVYIGKGTGGVNAGGLTGVQFGTWTQPNHTLITSEIPAHRHGLWFNAVNTAAVVGGINHPNVRTLNADGWTDSQAYYTQFGATGRYIMQTTGGGGAHNHGSSWRPKGRNYTRQQKN